MDGKIGHYGEAGSTALHPGVGAASTQCKDLRRKPASREENLAGFPSCRQGESPVKHKELMLARELQRDKKYFFQTFGGMVVLKGN